ncbi:Cation efflux system protein CusA [Acidisarcina polymorpha]|uniref:Cation efflux system protein CusA n=1 Tax=Acidisarcina polymorpha TaxID=2211140 RepID=A0A2Z5G4G0_9BACT|nr:TolC family protein [Acidisarcina polymorpha]AXC13617.1 Cation efflux system protein CusA [Acidisarcina polymorpha]
MRSSFRSLTVATTFAFAPLVMSAQRGNSPPAPEFVALNLSSPPPSSVQTTTPNSEQSRKQPPPLVNPDTPTVSITRSDAERLALKNNPRITASQLLALAAGQVTRETRSAALPQVTGYLTGEGAEDASRIGAGAGLTSSRLYSHFGAGGTLSQLITDFGHTRFLVATNKLQQQAQNQTTLATQQDVLLATDQAFYRLVDAQSLLDVANATVSARGDVQNLTSALTKSALKSNLDLNIASADLSQSQLLELDAENAVASASAMLAALLASPPETLYKAIEDPDRAAPPPPETSSTAVITAAAEMERPDLKSLKLNAESFRKLAKAQFLQHLPNITAQGTGGITPAGPAGVYVPDWYAAGGVNLTLPAFTGFRITAQTQEARLRAKATEQQARELTDNIARDVRVAILNAQTAFRRIAVADEFRRQTAQALALAQTRYKLGLSSIVELSQAQLQSTQAAVAAVNARYDYLLALRTLDYARGQLTP